MSHQFTFDIRPNGDDVEITIRGDDLPQAGQVFTRSIPSFAANQIDVFRAGDAKPKDIEELGKLVSEWLLGPDLKPLVGQWISKPGSDMLRLVFTIDSRVQLALNDLPFELIRTDSASDPIVVHPRVENFLYLLPKVGAPPSTSTLDWPMRVLLVRSNPGDLGGKVPPAGPIRDGILKMAEKQFGPNRVQVDLLSRDEPGAIGPPTWENFKLTASSQYDVMVYLGHGDLQIVHKDLPPVSQLQFENLNPAYHDPIASKRLATFLADHQIPAVVLAGCLTAADPAAAMPTNLATWMRGNQGMAQALVNSASGVMFAVGMRCKVDGTEASGFITEFFKNLFERDKGNLERAVRAARREMFGAKPFTSSWAAPVVFSSLPKEPVFEYLTRTGTFIMTAAINQELDFRESFWPMLADSPAAQRRASLMNAVNKNRDALKTQILKQGAMLLPEMVDGALGQTAAVPITLEGPFSCTYFQGKFSVGPGLKVGIARGTSLLLDRGYRVLNDMTDPGVFQIQQKDRKNAPAPLPNGKILEIDVSVAADASRVCPINLDAMATDTAQPFWPGNSAVIVPPDV